MASDLMDRVSSLEDGNAWPSTIELINDLADRITQQDAVIAGLVASIRKAISQMDQREKAKDTLKSALAKAKESRDD